MVAPPSLSESSAALSTELIAATPDEITEALSYTLQVANTQRTLLTDNQVGPRRS